MKIKKLPKDTITKIKSGIIITDATQCVLEMVYNSLDAEATCIIVQIDLRNYKIQVTDNGVGISSDDLNCVGERYMTSKYDSNQSNEYNFHTYGFKGQALSSILDVCKTMTIKTRCKNNGFTFIKIFQNNKVQSIKKKKMKENESEETGTCITVEDFMCSMPVRRKRIDEIFDIEEMKSQLKFLAIIHYNVSFTLRNENKCLILLHTEKTCNALNTIEKFCGASFCKSVKYISHQERNYKVVGYISLKAASLNNVQLFYVNKRIIGKGMIHKIISDVINKYIEKTNISPESSIKQGLVLKHLEQSSASFILEIQCSVSCYELFTNLRQCTVEFKKWKEVLKCIHNAIKKVFNLNGVNSSNSTTYEKENNDESKKIIRKRGTSALINALKGIPVKRIETAKEPNDYNRKLNGEDMEKFDSPINKMNGESNKYNLKKVKSQTSVIPLHKKHNSLTNDSLESPIPKKKVKYCMDSNAKFQLNFLEQFCDWLKSNREAFNFLKSFLLYNNLESNSEIQNSTLQKQKSLILEQKISKQKYVGGNYKNVVPAKDLTEISAHTLKKISEILKSTREEEVEISRNVTIANKHISKNSNTMFDRESTSTLNFCRQNNTNLSTSMKISEHPNYVQPFISTETHSSDIIFNNLMDLRNFSNKLDFQPSYKPKSNRREDKFSVAFSNTWKSHYENSLSDNELFHEFWQNKRCSDNQISDEFTRPENYDFRLEIIKCQENVRRFDNTSVISEKITSPKIQNVQCQVNLEEINGQKIDASVQTNITITENMSKWTTFTYEKKDVNEISPQIFENTQLSKTNYGNESHIIEKNKISDQNLTSSEEILNANFRVSCTLQDSKDMSEMKNGVDSGNENPTISINSIPKDKFSVSSDFICSTQTVNILLKEQTAVNDAPESLTFGENSADNSAKGIVHADTCSFSSPQLLPTVPTEKPSGEKLNLNQSNFHVTARYNFIPKGLSPNIINSGSPVTSLLSPNGKVQIKSTIEISKNEYLASVKWQDDCTGQSAKPTLLNGLLDEMRKKVEESANYLENEILNTSLSYCAIKVHNLLHSFTFTKELLSEVEVIGQLDRKFIVAKIMISEPKEMELISLFDQHAVDERIKLENLMRDYVTDDGELISSNLNPKIECKLGKSLVYTMTNMENKLLRFGLTWKTVNDTTILVETIPAFLLDKHSKDKRKKYESIDADIQALINNILEELSEVRGVISKIPKKVHNALCLEACRKAIKFNKALSKEEMVEMIRHLTRCKLPFQCAHGRPSVIPIIDLRDFNYTEETKSVDVNKVRKFLNS